MYDFYPNFESNQKFKSARTFPQTKRNQNNSNPQFKPMTGKLLSGFIRLPIPLFLLPPPPLFSTLIWTSALRFKNPPFLVEKKTDVKIRTKEEKSTEGQRTRSLGKVRTWRSFPLEKTRNKVKKILTEILESTDMN